MFFSGQPKLYIVLTSIQLFFHLFILLSSSTSIEVATHKAKGVYI